MFIAHLPAGYLASRALAGRTWRSTAIAVLAGSVVPDLDMLVFHFWDAGQVHHHHYLTHRPALWATLLLVGLVVRQGWVVGLGLGALLHLMLDSVVGAVDWGWPLFEMSAPLVIVPATQDHWILSFLFHWTILIEVAICAAALALWLNGKSPNR